MERIMPQHEYPRALINKYPLPGHDVSVKVGYELHFDDLIASHESKYGKLWKYSVLTEDQERRESFHEYWDSKATDLILYNKIMDRIEASLLALGEDMPHYGKVR